jgi:benzoyl-CoA reductase/2-hydroxyglutaryl-CoA dehydratase subunit BcrC/BadD/HgdB
MPVQRHNKEYIADQYRAAIKQLEDVTGRPFDYDKFLKVQEQVQRSVYWWNKVATYAARTPSPLNGFDLFNYMALIVCARARDYAEITFHKFADELEAKDAAGQYAFGAPENEKYRITWEGIAVWTYLGATFKGLKNQGAVMTGSAYPGIWNLQYTPGDLESMAEAYTKVYINTCGPNRYEDFLNIVKNAKSDGLVMHLNRSCKQMGLLNQEGAEYVNAKLGVPFVSFDGDQTDPNVFSQAQYETRIQALCEMMEENKK